MIVSSNLGHYLLFLQAGGRLTTRQILGEALLMRLMAQSPPVNLFHPGKDLGPGIVIQEFRHCLPVDLRPFQGGGRLPGSWPEYRYRSPWPPASD